MLLLLLLLQLRLLLLLLLPPAADVWGLLDGGVGRLIVMLELQVWHQADHVFSLLFHNDGLYIKFGDAGIAGVARCEQCNCYSGLFHNADSDLTVPVCPPTVVGTAHGPALHVTATAAGIAVIRANSMATGIWGVKVSSVICASTVNEVSMFSLLKIPGTQYCNILFGLIYYFGPVGGKSLM